MNPKKRIKTLMCTWPNMSKEEQQAAENDKRRAPNVTSDHRDTLIDKKIPPGYKLIGIKGFTDTSDSAVLHVADFIIWKPQTSWLDWSPQGLAKREQARLDLIRKKQMGISGQSWMSSMNQKPKNFIKLNHMKLKTQQAAFSQLHHQQQEEMKQKAIQTQGIFNIRKQRGKRNNVSDHFSSTQGGLDTYKTYQAFMMSSASLNQMATNMIPSKNGSKLFQIKTNHVQDSFQSRGDDHTPTAIN